MTLARTCVLVVVATLFGCGSVDDELPMPSVCLDGQDRHVCRSDQVCAEVLGVAGCYDRCDGSCEFCAEAFNGKQVCIPEQMREEFLAIYEDPRD